MTTPVPGLVTGHDVTQAVLAALETYLPTALTAVAPAGVILKVPVAYERPTKAAAKLAADDLPAVSVSTLGAQRAGGDDGEGSLALAFGVDVFYLVRSREGTYEATMRDAALYAAAISTVLNERGDLGGFARGTYSLDESYDEADASAGRTLAEGDVTCTVVVDDARRRQVQFTDAGYVPGVVSTTEVTVQPV